MRVQLLIICVLFAMRPAAAEEMKRPLVMMQLSALSFGTFTPTVSGGSVAVDAESGACRPEGVVMIRNFCEAGRVEIRGEPGAELLVEVIPEGVAGNGATLRNLHMATPQGGMVKLGYDGRAEVKIGGELAVGDMSGGDVAASYMLQVTYLY